MRHFGVAEANRLVPLLQQTFNRVRPLAEELARVEAQYLADPVPGGVLERKRDALKVELTALLDPVESLGIEVKALEGLADFRALRDGRTVYLCWRYGEEAVGFWHELHAGFAGRRPIEAFEEFMASFPS